MKKFKANCSVLNVLKNIPDFRFGFDDFIESYETDREVLEKMETKLSTTVGSDAISYLIVSEDLKFDGTDMIQSKLKQFMFARSIIDIFYYDLCIELPTLEICGTYSAEHNVLPVFCIDMPEYKLKIVFKNDFYHWFFAIDSENSINDLYLDKLSKENSEWLYYYKRKVIQIGMPESMHFSIYDEEKNNKKFISYSETEKDFYEFLLRVKTQLRKVLLLF